MFCFIVVCNCFVLFLFLFILLKSLNFETYRCQSIPACLYIGNNARPAYSGSNAKHHLRHCSQLVSPPRYPKLVSTTSCKDSKLNSHRCSSFVESPREKNIKQTMFQYPNIQPTNIVIILRVWVIKEQ